MLINFPKVKSLSFHPKKSWILASNYSGEIAIYNYETCVEVQKFSEYSVPVRSVNFHVTQPLFVAGGDDGIIKIFD